MLQKIVLVMTQNNIPTHAQPHGVRAKENKQKCIYLEIFFSSSTTATNPFLLFLSKKVTINPRLESAGDLTLHKLQNHTWR